MLGAGAGGTPNANSFSWGKRSLDGEWVDFDRPWLCVGCRATVWLQQDWGKGSMAGTLGTEVALGTVVCAVCNTLVHAMIQVLIPSFAVPVPGLVLGCPDHGWGTQHLHGFVGRPDPEKSGKVREM